MLGSSFSYSWSLVVGPCAVAAGPLFRPLCCTLHQHATNIKRPILLIFSPIGCIVLPHNRSSGIEIAFAVRLDRRRLQAVGWREASEPASSDDWARKRQRIERAVPQQPGGPGRRVPNNTLLPQALCRRGRRPESESHQIVAYPLSRAAKPQSVDARR